MDEHHWPLYRVRVRTPRLELRPPDERDQCALVDLAKKGVHDPSFMPFLTPWTDVESPERERNTLQFIWRCWAEWTPERWHLPFAVVVDDVVVGVQDINAEHFPTLGVVGTGSWLGLAHQGQGIGKEMRAAVLHFAFDGLGAVEVRTGAFEGNDSSLGVTRSLGYEPNGDELHLQREQPGRELRFKMTRTGFNRIRREDITIEGLDGARPMFGLDP